MSGWGKALVEGMRLSAAGLADLFLPSVCAACGADDVAEAGLCAACNVKLLSLVSLPYCPRCGATVGPNIPIREDGCAACDTTLPRFARVVRLGPYTEPLRSIVRDLKYSRWQGLCGHLGCLLGEAVETTCEAESFDLAMPVPMHWRRRLARGSDHARVLGRAVAGRLDLPLGDELIRVRHTPPQVGLPRSKRAGNVRGAFGVSRPAAVEGAKIVLVDDVTTTGATANEATRALLGAGALRVVLAVATKSEPPTAYTQHWAQ